MDKNQQGSDDQPVRRITKVRIDSEDRIEVRYQQQSRDGAGWDEYTMICRDRARPEFYECMTDFVHSVIELCELPEMYSTGMTIRGVTLNYAGEADTMGATITALKKLATCNSPLVINTPNRPAEPYNADSEDNFGCLDTATIGRIAALIDEVNLYIDGERAQLSLFREAA